MHPPLQNPKYASDVNMPNKMTERGLKNINVFFIQRLQTFFIFVTFFTFLTFFIYFFLERLFYIYGLAHSLLRARRRLQLQLDFYSTAVDRSTPIRRPTSRL